MCDCHSSTPNCSCKQPAADPSWASTHYVARFCTKCGAKFGSQLKLNEHGACSDRIGDPRAVYGIWQECTSPDTFPGFVPSWSFGEFGLLEIAYATAKKMNSVSDHSIIYQVRRKT